MGVQLSRLLEPSELEIEDLAGKKIAIDTFNTLFQFLTTIRQYDGTPLMDSSGRVTSHLSGLFYRTVRFIEAGIKPIYVFDGAPPGFKKTEVRDRQERRAEAAKKMKEAEEAGDVEARRKWSQQAATLTDDMIIESKALLDVLGIPWIQAPSEGEAQAVWLCQKGEAWCVASQDYDSLLFGANRLVRNLSITGKKKRGSGYIQVNPELLVLEEQLSRLGINKDQLVLLGLLVGTDYNQSGIHGIGPMKALDLVKKYPKLAELKENISWEFSTPIEELFEFFKSPPVERSVSIKWEKPDNDSVIRLLVDEHDFSKDRIESALEKIKSAKRNSSLDRWTG